MSEDQPTTSRKRNERSAETEETPASTEGRRESTLESIRKTMLNLFERLSVSVTDNTQRKKMVIPNLTFDGFISHWKKEGFKKIITMVGAGISTSAGIPDFRSPGSGLYSQLEKYNLPHPQAIFELDYFIDNPKPFFALAKELYPGRYIPTPTHFFIRLLNEKGLLVRHYTQNIDMLERVAGIPEEKLVEAHGTFYTNHCVECNKEHSKEWMEEKIFTDNLPFCEECSSIVKPDIVFFGENLVQRFYDLPEIDFKKCDLLMVIGTSLEVYPFANLIDNANSNCLRVVINRTKIDTSDMVSSPQAAFRLGSSSNTRDIAFIGDCDDAVWKIAAALGWTHELQEMIDAESKKIKESKKEFKVDAKQTPKGFKEKKKEKHSKFDLTQ